MVHVFIRPNQRVPQMNGTFNINIHDLNPPLEYHLEYEEERPAKCTCLAKSTDEYSTKVRHSLISNSLASRIGGRTLWEDETDTVSLGSPACELHDPLGTDLWKRRIICVTKP